MNTTGSVELDDLYEDVDKLIDELRNKQYEIEFKIDHEYMANQKKTFYIGYVAALKDCIDQIKEL